VEKLKKKRAFLIDVPPGTVLILNLLVGQVGCSAATDLPHELLPAARPLWQATLRDRRPVVLTARVMEMDKQNRDEIMFVRNELIPKMTFSEPLTEDPYIEVRRVVWDPKGGNVILVVPMGKEAVRVQDDIFDSLASDTESRTVTISSPSASIPIAAPNGAIVGTFSIAGATNELTLRKNKEVRGSLGTVTLSIIPDSLIWGQSFKRSPYFCSCVPTVDGSQPRSWEYSVLPSFDGTTFGVEIRQLSTGLRSANLTAPMPSLGATEEIVMTAPMGKLVLQATAVAPESSSALEGKFLLRDV